MSSKRTIYNTTIEKIIDHTPTVRELLIKTSEPESFLFRAGQFAMLHVPQAGAEKPALRAYSIASDDRQKNGFRLLFKFVPNGVASQYVWSLKANQQIQFTGPFGRVFFAEPPAQQIVFLSTGTGLSQHLCYLTSKADLFPDLHYTLFFGVRNESDIFCENELIAFKNKFKNFNYHIVLSKPSPQWKGITGYVQHQLKNIDYKNTPTQFYLCGNGHMIKETKSILIERDGIAPTQVFSEAFD